MVSGNHQGKMNSGSQVNGGHIFGVCLLKAGGVEVEFDKGTVTTVIAFFLKNPCLSSPLPEISQFSFFLMSVVLFKMLPLCWSL